MTFDEVQRLAQEIVAEALVLSNKHTKQSNAPVNYACIFSQSEAEFTDLCEAVATLSTIADETKAGPVFRIPPTPTAAGRLDLLKIRRPDVNRAERGDADFTVADYSSFKIEYIGKPGFRLIERPEMEMIELVDAGFNVLAYYSHPILAEVIERRAAAAAQ